MLIIIFNCINKPRTFPFVFKIRKPKGAAIIFFYLQNLQCLSQVLIWKSPTKDITEKERNNLNANTYTCLHMSAIFFIDLAFLELQVYSKIAHKGEYF